MTPLAILLLIQETLPPPPEPTSAPEINTAQVIGIVILSLGLIVIAALAMRPLVGRRSRVEEPESEPTPTEETPIPPTERSAHRPIIQFPVPPDRTPEPPSNWDAAGPSIEERFGRVLGDSANRRKLGDRRPARRAHDLAIAALHRLDTEPQPRNGANGTAIAERPIVPIDERRLSAVERVPHGQILQWQGTIAPDPVSTLPERGEDEPTTSDAGEEDSTLDESFALWPANDRATSEASAKPGAQAIADSIKTEDATQEFIVTKREQVPEEPAQPPVAESDYGLDIAGVDTQTLAEISQVLRDLIYCANSGQLFHGFALYSDPYLFRFMDGTGLTEDEFREVYGSIGSRPAESWERLDRLSDVVRRPDGRVEATVSYVDVEGKPTSGRERFRFALDSERRVWMIDDIAALDDRSD